MMLLPSFTFVITSLISLLIPLQADGQRFEGSPCTVDNGAGVCKPLGKCPSAYNDLLAGNPPKEVCSYSGFEPIICCPNESSNPATQEPTTGPQVETRGAKSRQKCGEYVKASYGLQVAPILTANRKPQNVSFCNLNIRKLVVGGTKSDPKEFPHMAAIGFNSGSNILWLCGGTLISERYVLSAAHCTFDSDRGAASWARLGDLNLIRDDDGAKPENHRIIERIRNPNYKRPSQYHDIALFKLEKNVRFNAWIRPACLPYDDISLLTAMATGWGRVEWTDEEGSSDLLKVTLTIVEHNSCNKSFSDGGSDPKLNRGIVDEWQICAGGIGKDTCQGDSGGPLAIYNPDYKCMYTVVGITSLGRLCGSIIPGVYTRVSYYVPWIESVVWPDNA